MRYVIEFQNVGDKACVLLGPRRMRLFQERVGSIVARAGIAGAPMGSLHKHSLQTEAG